MYERILGRHLGLKSGENLLIIADGAGSHREEAARAAADVAERIGGRPKVVIYPETGCHGREPPLPVWEAAGLAGLDGIGRLLSKEASDEDLEAALRGAAGIQGLPDLILAMTRYSTSHTSFRKIMTEGARARYASMPTFDSHLLREGGPLDLDPAELAGETRRAAGALSGSEMIEITAPNGTSLTMETVGRAFTPDDGDYTEPGAFGNLPAGEVYTAPVEGSAEGRLVFEYAPTRALSSPISITIREGRAVAIEGGDTYADELRGILGERPDLLQVGELGIGTNRGASRPDNILEAEKILGTIHIALGDNIGLGGRLRLPFHTDYVVYDPVMKADGRIIIDSGRPLW